MKGSGRRAGPAEGKRRRAVRPAKGAGASHVYNRLRKEILSLALMPGDDLDEGQIVDRFGMSRTPVREAIIRLAGEGLVVLHPNRGAHVAPLDLTDFPMFVEAFDLLQRAVTRLAALRRNEADLKQIAAAQQHFEVVVRRGDALEMTEANRLFHAAVAAASHNPHLSAPYERMLFKGMRMLRIPFAYSPIDAISVEHHRKKIIYEHRIMVSAIRDGDGERADVLAHQHTTTFRSRFEVFLSQNFASALDLRVGDSAASGSRDARLTGGRSG